MDFSPFSSVIIFVTVCTFSVCFGFNRHRIVSVWKEDLLLHMKLQGGIIK